jgi:hypothetical protein
MVVLIQTGFAAVTDLQARLKKVFPEDEQEWVQTLLDDASDHLREILGWQVWPAAVVTVRTKVRCGDHYTLPIQPVMSVDSVLVDGAAVTVEQYDGGIEFSDTGIADITFTAGYTEIPRILTKWTCVLAAQVIDVVTKLGMLSNGSLSSVAIDDFKMVWAQTGESSSGNGLPDAVVAQLRESFGTTVYVTGR